MGENCGAATRVDREHHLGLAIVPTDRSEPERDRRVTPDRRAVTRGGRRGDKRSQPDRDTIASLLKEIALLREENELLRRAALAFGALAERLNTALRSGGV